MGEKNGQTQSFFCPFAFAYVASIHREYRPRVKAATVNGYVHSHLSVCVFFLCVCISVCPLPSSLGVWAPHRRGGSGFDGLASAWRWPHRWNPPERRADWAHLSSDTSQPRSAKKMMSSNIRVCFSSYSKCLKSSHENPIKKQKKKNKHSCACFYLFLDKM